MLYNTWAYKVYPNKHPCYQPDVDWAYWPVLGSFNDWNIIQITSKTTSSEDFYLLHKVVLGGISWNMDYLVYLGKYGAIDAAYPTTIGYYVIKYLSEPYTLNEYQTTYGQVSKAG